MSNPAGPRSTPCASCPYRKSTPSGIWAEDEYQKLPAYDGPTVEQNPRAFRCHQNGIDVCSGWLAHSDPADLLAVRIGVITGRLDPACLEYSTDVELFASGAEAAAHGMKNLQTPDERARRAIKQLRKKRDLEIPPRSS